MFVITLSMQIIYLLFLTCFKFNFAFVFTAAVIKSGMETILANPT